MNLSTLMALEILVDLTTIGFSLLALSRLVPPSWKAAATAALKTIAIPRGRRPKTHPAPASGTGKPVLPTAGRIATAAPVLGAYDQIPVLAATGLSAAQIVQRLGLTRSEVDLALKMRHCGQAGLNG